MSQTKQVQYSFKSIATSWDTKCLNQRTAHQSHLLPNSTHCWFVGQQSPFNSNTRAKQSSMHTSTTIRDWTIGLPSSLSDFHGLPQPSVLFWAPTELLLRVNESTGLLSWLRSLSNQQDRSTYCVDLSHRGQVDPIASDFRTTHPSSSNGLWMNASDSTKLLLQNCQIVLSNCHSGTVKSYCHFELSNCCQW